MTPAKPPKPRPDGNPAQQGNPERGTTAPLPHAPLAPSPLALALMEALPRLCGGDTPTNSPTDTTLVELIGALAAALERGELELDLDGPAPEAIDPQGWPERHRLALAASPLAVRACELEQLPEAPLVWSEGRLRWRRWHLQLESCLGLLTARAQAPLSPPLEPTAVGTAATTFTFCAWIMGL